MRRSLCIVAGCFLVLCGCSSDPVYVPVTHPDNYDALKTVLQQAYDKGLLDSGIHDRHDSEVKNAYDISSAAACHESIDFLGSFDDPSKIGGVLLSERNADISQFVLIAVEVVIWENDFRRLGIPERAWRPWLKYYEDKALSGKPSSGPIMAAVLNKDMSDAGVSAPKFVFDPGCGEGGIDVHLELKPVDGQLFLIPVFLYKLCEVKHLNPLDFKSCDRWKEIFSERVWNVSGDYMYLARWPDGVVRCGTLTYDDFAKNADTHDYNVVITKLRSPECSPAW